MARVDFLHPRRTPRLGWVLLVAGGAALFAALWVDQRWSAERATREAAARVREQAVWQQRAEALRPVPPSPDERRLQSITPVLRQPWLPVLRVIENATEPPVFLLGVSIDPGNGNVRLEAEGPDFDQALAYAQRLDEEGLIGRAQLRSHEQVVDSTGRATVRFAIVTRWSAR
jgi:hypothetical protein